MTATEKLQHLIREVANQMALRGMPAHKRATDWPIRLREQNAKVAALLVEYSDPAELPAGQELPELPELPADPDVPVLPELPPAPPARSAEKKAEKPKPKRRGGQHND